MKVEFDEQSDFLVARPSLDSSAMKSVLGCAAEYENGKDSQTVLASIRGYERARLR
ncbi:MAG: hypothetical protein SH807_00235 [Blastochloris sp.]|jgi:hypothetical protein|nr:hypothetical protein [Blastochloris sp.]